MNIKQFIQLIIILIIAIFLRAAFLDKPQGLWNDEYVSWFIASQNSFSTFFQEMMKNCHMPFYYFYLKFWLLCFPDTDVSLRISSVIPGILSVLMMFFLGKEFKDVKNGVVCAVLTALSSFLIYYSQEVRFYSLLFLFSVFLIYFWLKLSKEFSFKNYILFLLFAFLVIFTHTLGFIFVIPVAFLLFKYLFDDNRMNLKQIACYSLPFAITFVLALPFLFKIMFTQSLAQFWSGFNFSKVLFVFNDYFSPVLHNIINSDSNFMSLLFDGAKFHFPFLFFSLFPICISIAFIIKAFLEKDKKLNFLLISALIYFSALIIAAIFEKIVFITKYSIEIYPILLLAFAFGITTLKHKFFAVAGFVYLIIINLLFLTFSPNAAQKLIRDEGNNIPAALIKSANIASDDIIVLTYYDKTKFERYIDFSQYDLVEITKYSYPYYIFDVTNKFVPIRRDKEMRYKSLFVNNETQIFSNVLSNTLFSRVKPKQKVVFIFLNNVSFFTLDDIWKIAQNDAEYAKTPFVFLVFSYIKNNIVKIVATQNLVLDKYYESGAWTLISFVKE